MNLFVGIDWGYEAHTVCVVNSSKEIVHEEEVAHRGDAVLAFLDRVIELAGGSPSSVVAAMESPRGTMIEGLLERGVACYHINPKQLDRLRDRHSVAGAKDDDLDAFVLGTSLIGDRELFRKIEIPSEAVLRLRALSRGHEALSDQMTALGNQGADMLQSFYPQLTSLGSWHREPWMWDIFEAAPTPRDANRLRPVKVRAILKKHRIRRHSAEDVLATLRQTPVPQAPGVAEAASERVLLLVPIARATHEQLVSCDKRIEQLVGESGTSSSPDASQHDAAIILSLPGIGTHTCAVLLSEASAAIQQRNYQELRSLSGSAPVSRRTGGRRKKPQVIMRRACSLRVRNATYHWARVASQCEPRARGHYASLRARGHSHGRAVRGVADRLLKVLVAMLESQKLYDQERRHNTDAALAENTKPRKAA